MLSNLFKHFPNSANSSTYCEEFFLLLYLNGIIINVWCFLKIYQSMVFFSPSSLPFLSPLFFLFFFFFSPPFLFPFLSPPSSSSYTHNTNTHTHIITFLSFLFYWIHNIQVWILFNGIFYFWLSWIHSKHLRILFNNIFF